MTISLAEEHGLQDLAEYLEARVTAHVEPSTHVLISAEDAARLCALLTGRDAPVHPSRIEAAAAPVADYMFDDPAAELPAEPGEPAPEADPLPWSLGSVQRD